MTKTTSLLPGKIVHALSASFYTGHPATKSGSPAIIDTCPGSENSVFVLKCSCGFEAKGKYWAEVGRMLDDHILGK